LLERESAQARSILESAVLLHEARTELRAYLFAMRSLRSLLGTAGDWGAVAVAAVGVANGEENGVANGVANGSANGAAEREEEGPYTDVGVDVDSNEQERSEDLEAQQETLQLMHQYGEFLTECGSVERQKEFLAECGNLERELEDLIGSGA
ncbi:hypothetical protein B484DRAFT_410446, partial [Ochromonadaceae sp. CCMP2298]